jgi:hypothetical protein
MHRFWVVRLPDRCMNGSLDFAGPFHGALAAVKIGDRYGYIEVHGKFVIQPKFDWAGPFREHRALLDSNRRGEHKKQNKKAILSENGGF